MKVVSTEGFETGRPAQRASTWQAEAVLWLAAAANVMASGGLELRLRLSPPVAGYTVEPGLVLPVQYAMAAAALAVIGYHASRGQSLRPFVWPFGMMAIFFALLANASDAYNSFRNLVLFLTPSLLAVAQVMSLDRRKVLEVAIRTVCLVVFGSLVGVILDPIYSIHNANDLYQAHTGAWRGLFSHKNGFGHAIGMCIVITLSIGLGSLRSRTLAAALIAVAMVELFMSRSASALMISLIAITLSLVLRTGRPAPVRVQIVQLFALVGLLAVPILLLLQEQIATLLDRDASLTGRVPLWQFLLERLDTVQWLGKGLSEYETNYFPVLSVIAGPFYTDPHNGYLDAYISVGILGLVVLGALIVRGLAGAFSLLNRPDPESRALGRATLGVTIYMLCSSVVESQLIRGLDAVSAFAYFYLTAAIALSVKQAAD